MGSLKVEPFQMVTINYWFCSCCGWWYCVFQAFVLALCDSASFWITLGCFTFHDNIVCIYSCSCCGHPRENNSSLTGGSSLFKYAVSCGLIFLLLKYVKLSTGFVIY